MAGLSSGGGETMVLGCMAPDIFAGVGINAGPPPGTTTAQIGSVPSGYTATTAANNCKALAGSNSGQFASQIAGVVWGTSRLHGVPALRTDGRRRHAPRLRRQLTPSSRP